MAKFSRVNADGHGNDPGQLHTGPNGAYPIGGLIQASDGNLCGTANGGGGGATHYGTVFRVTLDGTLTTIFTFTFDAVTGLTPNGANPEAALVQSTDGNLCGTTINGGGGAKSAAMARSLRCRLLEHC